MAESSQRRRSVLERYRSDLAKRPTLEQWRENVPRAARRAWLERFFSDVMVEKITNDTFWNFLQKELSPAVFAHVTELRAPITRLEEAAAVATSRTEKEDIGFKVLGIADDVRDSIEEYLQSVTDDHLIDAFADVYINSFARDAVVVAEFETEKHEQLLAAKPYLDRLGSRGVELLVAECGGVFPGAWMDARLFNFVKRPIVQPVPDRPVFSGMLVCGSAAIGPRDATIYPQKQDIDVLLLPSLSAQPRGLTEVLASGVEFLSSASHEIQEMSPSKRTRVLRKLLVMGEPELVAALRYAVAHQREYDMRLLRYPFNMERDPGGAYKLVGPTQRFDDIVPLVESDYTTLHQAAITGVLESAGATD